MFHICTCMYVMKNADSVYLVETSMQWKLKTQMLLRLSLHYDITLNPCMNIVSHVFRIENKPCITMQQLNQNVI